MPLVIPGVEMQGDVFLAARRGHNYSTMTAEMIEQKTTLPDLYQKVLQLCQLVQYVDAAANSGRIKGTGEKVILLTMDEDFSNNALITAWDTQAASNKRNYVLHALLNVQ